MQKRNEPEKELYKADDVMIKLYIEQIFITVEIVL